MSETIYKESCFNIEHKPIMKHILGYKIKEIGTTAY